MKVAVSSTGQDLDSQVDPRFGRCPYFIIVDSETMKYEIITNSYAMAYGGAGIQTAQMLANRGVEVVITGNCGPNAYQTLTIAGVQIVISIEGTITGAIQAFKEGRLSFATAPNVTMHFGMRAGMGAGFGRGMGRGRGGGMGRGFCGGRGTPPFQDAQEVPEQTVMPEEQEIQTLKNQSEMLKQQLEQINNRIKQIGKNRR